VEPATAGGIGAGNSTAKQRTGAARQRGDTCKASGSSVRVLAHDPVSNNPRPLRDVRRAACAQALHALPSASCTTPKGASARVLSVRSNKAQAVRNSEGRALVPVNKQGTTTSTPGVKVGGSAPFAPSSVGIGTLLSERYRSRVVPRSDSSATASSVNARSCTGVMLAAVNCADKVFVQSLREVFYVHDQALSLPAVIQGMELVSCIICTGSVSCMTLHVFYNAASVLHAHDAYLHVHCVQGSAVLHAMAGTPNKKHMIAHDLHPDDIQTIRLLPTDVQLAGAGLHHVSAAIRDNFNGWDAVARASDPHGIRTSHPLSLSHPHEPIHSLMRYQDFFL
jgi:hypothetical protein